MQTHCLTPLKSGCYSCKRRLADKLIKDTTPTLTTSLIIELDKVILTQSRAEKLFGIKALHPKYTVVADVVCLYIAVITGAIHGLRYANKHTSIENKLNIHLLFRDTTYNIQDEMHSYLMSTAMKAIKIFTNKKIFIYET